MGAADPPGLNVPDLQWRRRLVAASDPEPQGLIVALGSHRQDLRFDSVGRRSILSNFPCPTERILPLLGILGFLLLARALAHAPPFPSHHQYPGRNTDLPPWRRDPRHVCDSSAQFAVPLLESFASHSPPLGSHHVSVLRFCISAPSGPGTVARPSPFPLSFTGQQPLQRRQALWTGMIYTNQLTFLVA